MNKKLKSTFVLIGACIALAASGCGDSETGGTSNPSTITGGVGGTAGTGGTIGGTGATTGGTGISGMGAGMGGASGMSAVSGGSGGAGGTAGGVTGGAGGMTGGTGGAGGTTGGSGGATGGTGGTTGGTGGTMEIVDPEVAACIDTHFDGVDATCKECMCECDTISSDCDETCWQLSSCTYQHCQMGNPVNQGRDNQTQCIIDFCGIYLGSDQGSTATAVTNTGCFTMCGTPCFSWWGTPIEPGPMSLP